MVELLARVDAEVAEGLPATATGLVLAVEHKVRGVFIIVDDE